MENMNIHARIAKVKLDLTKKEIKKSGHNKFAGFKYHELQDFLEHIVELNDKHGINDTIHIDPQTGVAKLRLTNADNKEDYAETIVPYVEAQMTSKTDPVQRMGATITYMRRYLYMTAYAIQENDAIDSADPTEKPKGLSPQENAKQRESFKKWLRGEHSTDYDDALAFALNEVGASTLEEVKFSGAVKQQLAKGVKKYEKKQEVESV